MVVIICNCVLLLRIVCTFSIFTAVMWVDWCQFLKFRKEIEGSKVAAPLPGSLLGIVCTLASVFMWIGPRWAEQWLWLWLCLSISEGLHRENQGQDPDACLACLYLPWALPKWPLQDLELMVFSGFLVCSPKFSTESQEFREWFSFRKWICMEQSGQSTLGSGYRSPTAPGQVLRSCLETEAGAMCLAPQALRSRQEQPCEKDSDWPVQRKDCFCGLRGRLGLASCCLRPHCVGCLLGRVGCPRGSGGFWDVCSSAEASVLWGSASGIQGDWRPEAVTGRWASLQVSCFPVLSRPSRRMEVKTFPFRLLLAVDADIGKLLLEFSRVEGWRVLSVLQWIYGLNKNVLLYPSTSKLCIVVLPE